MVGAPAAEDERRSSQGAAFERHYSVDQLAKLWGMSDDFIRRLFIEERDVVVFFNTRAGRRTYRTLRIPASVAERVHCRMRKRER